MAQTRGLRYRRRDERDISRRPRQRRRGELDPLLQLQLDLAELMKNGQLLAGGKLEVSHEMCHEVAVPLIGRDSAARGVQMLQISELFQRGHLIADGGRRDSD